MLKEGLISGSPDEKEEAARVLIEVIHLSSSKTLSTGKVVMLIAGPLIRVLGDRYGWSVKVATLEALVELIRKVSTTYIVSSFVVIAILYVAMVTLYFHHYRSEQLQNHSYHSFRLHISKLLEM